MAGKHTTLTVQDVLWLYQEVTGRAAQFRYAALEEATFYQFGYGASDDVLGQAGRFLAGFVAKAPFSEGNEAVAVLGALAYLRLNGRLVDRADPARLLAAAREGKESATRALESLSRPDPHPPHEIKPDVRAILRDVLDSQPRLATADSAVS